MTLSAPVPPPPSGAQGARRRRRGLYGPPPRLTLTSPLTGRLLWAIGDWGRASEHVGDRWEQVAVALARAQLGADEYLIALHETPDLMAEVIGTNLSHADALRAHPLEGPPRLGLEALDFKWSLETASVKQVSAETLARLLELELPRLAQAIQRAKAALGVDETVPVEPLDGRFLAPQHPANRAALRHDPGLPTLILPLDPQAFFRPLPGWPAATELARIERVELERLSSVEAVERYYRLGAGVRGALTKLRTGLFDDQPAPVDVTVEIERLRREGHTRTLNSLLVHLQARLAERRALDEEVASLPRMLYPFNRLRAELARLKVPRAVLDNRGQLGRAHGEVTRHLSAEIRAAGRDLVAMGVSDREALAQLAATPERWQLAARQPLQAVAERLRTAPTAPVPREVGPEITPAG